MSRAGQGAGAENTAGQRFGAGPPKKDGSTVAVKLTPDEMKIVREWLNPSNKSPEYMGN